MSKENYLASVADRILFPLELNQFPKQFYELESKAIVERRKQAGEDPVKGRIGLALSGGGIRSATFALGILQALAKNHLLRKVDYLSTVSGGGYIGSFLGMLFVRPWVNLKNPMDEISELKDSYRPVEKGQPEAQNTVGRVENILAPKNLNSRPVDWLRNNGRYLSPNGSGDTLLATSVYLRNWVAVQVVLSVLFLTLFLFASGLRAIGSYLNLYSLPCVRDIIPGMPSGLVWWSPYILLPLFTVVFLVIPLAWAYWLITGEKSDASSGLTRHPWITVFAFVIVLGVVQAIRPSMGSTSPTFSAFLFVLTLCSALTLVVWIITWKFWISREAEMSRASRALLLRNRLSSLLSMWLWISVGLLVFAIVDSLGQTVYAYLRHMGLFKGLSSFKALAAAAGITGFMAMAQRITILLGGFLGKGRPKLPVQLLASLAAIALLLVVLTSLSFIAHGFAWGWQIPYGNPGHMIWENCAPKDKVGPSSETHIVIQEAGAGDSVAVTDDNMVEIVPHDNWQWLSITLLVCIGLTYAFGQTFQFLNQSSHAALYGARLTRAYPGASNPIRLSGSGRSVTEVIKGDEVKMKEYTPHVMGGPIHLINVTLNETVSGKSQVEQRDRKGLGMAVSPFGISVGVNHHALWDKPADGVPEGDRNRFHIFQSETPHGGIFCEPLSLGQWTGISGAAFSTGLGSRTSLGLSLLCGMVNLRLGYWWGSGVDPDVRTAMVGDVRFTRRIGKALAKAFPVQMYMLNEFTARFHGPARPHWYLTDGGHFENTACYELIRRRVPLIIVCDNGCDPAYDFSDVANLVRKARKDFNAEIMFLTDAELKDVLTDSAYLFIGPLEQLRRGKWSEELLPKDEKKRTITPDEAGFSQAHAALAKICYDGNPKAESILLLIKPTLTGEEPIDVVEYHEAHEDFPQESTGDQYFDEAQWESYRKLGEWIGTRLFGAPRGESEVLKWSPSQMDIASLLEKVNLLNSRS
ncbi:MAG: patatin-like phospholipase family protein [Acidobacteriia bacterium]|nr:patatin-like phospholipase family protein [Terriglobia bacterium]